jgi:hypothetical protein
MTELLADGRTAFWFATEGHMSRYRGVTVFAYFQT